MEEILCRWINCAGLIHARLTRAYPPVVWKQRRYANFCRWIGKILRGIIMETKHRACAPEFPKGEISTTILEHFASLCLRRLPVYSRRAMWKTAGYSMLPFKIFIEIYCIKLIQIMYKHRIKIYRNI